MYKFGGIVCQLSYESSEVADGFRNIYRAIEQQETREAAALLNRMEERLIRNVPEPSPDLLDDLVDAYEALFYLRKRLAAQCSFLDASPHRFTLPS